MTILLTENKEITTQNIADVMADFKENYQPNLIKLGEYYDGKNKIVKMGAVENRPNYEINANLAKYITDVQTSYFLGKGVSYLYEDEKLQEVVDPVLFNNFEEDKNFAIASDMSCYGSGFDVVLASGDTKPRPEFYKLEPENTFLVAENNVKKNILYAVNFYETIATSTVASQTKGYIYTDQVIQEFTLKEKAVTFGDTIPHVFGEIPVTHFPNNFDLVGDFEPVLSLLDAISLTISNETDDLQSIANAILAIYGAVGTTEEDINLINKTKVATLAADSKMEFVTKDINIDAIKHNLDTCLEMAYQISKTPDLTSTEFGGQQSGESMEFKMWGLEQSRLSKVRNFKTALLKRLKLIINFTNITQMDKTNYDLQKDITINFYKNLPRGDSKTIELVKNLAGIVSMKTLFSQIPFIENADEEIEEIAKEKQAEFGIYDDNPINNEE